EVLREMTADFHVLYVETRDKSSAQVSRKADYSVAALAQDLAAVTAHYQLAPSDYILLGSSLGGTAILECYRLLAAKPRCLVLIGPAALFHLPPMSYTVIRFFPPRLYLLIKPIIKLYLRLTQVDAKADYAQYEKYVRVLDSADPWKLKRGALSLAHYQVWDRLAAIDCPTLIFGGVHDVMHIPENLKRITDLLPQGRYLDLGTNRATHSPEMVVAVRVYLDELEHEG
ncbi:MAG: alpha/beta hydrolase, partial [Candidatus Neomarinimicrobiota bacterium]